MKNVVLILLLFIASSSIYAQTTDAKTIIKEACAEAGKQHKNALIIFHASWCIWCHKLDSSINDISCNNFFNNNFVIQHITAFEVGKNEKLNTLGAIEFLKAHHADEQGIPVWFIFDKDGNLLADSQLRHNGQSKNEEGINVGCPSNETEINYFISVLEKTSTISNDEEAAIKKRFAANRATQ
jgi:thiol-disulfide isomerase/thioredoxin